MHSVIRNGGRVSGGLLSLMVAGLALLAGAGSAAGGPVYFVVAEREPFHRDSYVLPLTEPADIAHARDLIARGPEAVGAPIVFAEVRAGADGINRNVVAPGRPLWNWHVSRFEGFGDFGIELVDGWPTYVGQDVAGWIANTSRDQGNPDAPGHIGFWTYTVVAELDGPPAAVPLPAALPVGLAGLAGVVVLRRAFVAWAK